MLFSKNSTCSSHLARSRLAELSTMLLRKNAPLLSYLAGSRITELLTVLLTKNPAFKGLLYVIGVGLGELPALQR